MLLYAATTGTTGATEVSLSRYILFQISCLSALNFQYYLSLKLDLHPFARFFPRWIFARVFMDVVFFWT